MPANTSMQSVLSPYLSGLLRGRAPGQLIIQLTDRCNARCPQCGMRVTERFPRSRLAMEKIKPLLDAASRRGISAVSFTGGEPFLYLDDLIELINYAGKLGFSYIRTGTNGYLFRDPTHPDFNDRVNRLAERLAATPLRNLWISIDSAEPAIHEQMRGFPGVIDGIARALPIFHAHGIYPSANIGLNRNITARTATIDERFPHHGPEEATVFFHEFQAALTRFFRLIIDMGFTMSSICYPMSGEAPSTVAAGTTDAVYGATSTDRIVSFSPQAKALLYTSLLATIPLFRSQIRIFTPLSSLLALHNQHAGTESVAYSCRGGKDYFFADCREGRIYPCGYRGGEALDGVFEKWPTPADSDHCRRCDWECFRDPSELFGPLLHMRSKPFSFLAQCRKNPEAARLWRQDLRYIKACDWFDGRRNLNPERLRKFFIKTRSFANLSSLQQSPAGKKGLSCLIP